MVHPAVAREKSRGLRDEREPSAPAVRADTATSGAGEVSARPSITRN